jgi:activating signal cointegrator 1
VRALSLHQPHASLVAHGLKKIETRGPRSPRAYRGPLLIHAAKKWTPAQVRTLMRLSASHDPATLLCGGYGPWIETAAQPLPLGALVAVARVVDIREMTPEWIAEQTPLERAVGDWQPGRYGWVLEDVVPLATPIPLRGSQGLFNVTPAHLPNSDANSTVCNALSRMQAMKSARAWEVANG